VTEAIWIKRKAQTEQTLWETHYYEAYTLVDDDHRPLRDEQDQEYLFKTLAEAERKIRELLAPLHNALAHAYAESQVSA
jgi:hypothetical protein